MLRYANVHGAELTATEKILRQILNDPLNEPFEGPMVTNCTGVSTHKQEVSNIEQARTESALGLKSTYEVVTQTQRRKNHFLDQPKGES